MAKDRDHSSPDRNIFSYITDMVSGVHERVDTIQQGQKIPTIPVYDSSNFPDDATRGQIARDILDPTVMWVYGEDDEWHLIGAPGTNLFLRYFSIHIDHTPALAAGPYSGAPDKIINWTSYVGSLPVWGTNDSVDGSVVSGNVNTAFSSGEFFSYDPAFPNQINGSKAGIYFLEAAVDLRTYGGIGSPYDFYTVLGIDGTIQGVQSPQAVKHEKNTQYDTTLTLDVVQMGFAPIYLPGGAWGVRFGHNYSSPIAFTVNFTVVWAGELIKGFVP